VRKYIAVIIVYSNAPFSLTGKGGFLLHKCMGRPPIPKAINDARGDPGKKRRYQTEPVAPTGKPLCPKHLGRVAKQEWKSIVPLLEQLGVLSKIDRSALEIYCSAYGRYRQAQQELEKTGYVLTTPNGFKMKSPWVAIMNEALNQCKRFLIEFGLTPAARAKLSIRQGSDQKEDIKQFMKGG